MGWIQSAYHVQALAMTANLASYGVGGTYRQVAAAFRWALLSDQASLPFLSGPLNDDPRVSISPPDQGSYQGQGSISPSPLNESSSNPTLTKRSASRILLLNSSISPAPPSPSPSSPDGASSSYVFSGPWIKPQGLAYSVIVAVLLLLIVAVAHIVLVVLYRILSTTPSAQVPPDLRLFR